MRTAALACGLVLASWSCTSLDGPDLDDPTTEDLQTDPSRSVIAASALGLVRGQRDAVLGFVFELGVFGREGYELRPEEPRAVTGRLVDPLFGFSPFWDFGYRRIRNALALLQAVDETSELTLEEKEATRGFAKTFLALEFFQVAVTHEPLPIPLDVDRDPREELAPLESQDIVHARIAELFDEAEVHLRGGGMAFPFQLPPGLADFDAPVTFALVNRALKARALKYQGRWPEVLTELSRSFLVDGGSLDRGVYLDFSFDPDDGPNPLALLRGSTLFAHPRLLRDAELRTDGTPDLRAQRKLSSIPPFALQGITVTEQFDVYLTPLDPVPWIRVEELLLLRAEASLALGNESAAIRDLNEIRVSSGGLTPLPHPFPGDLLRQLLYEKRYSLMWEGGFTYLDARQYGRTGDTPDQLPRAAPDHVVYPRYPYPLQECLARGIESDPGCQPVVGF